MSDWPVWLLAIVDVLAAHRLTRLVTEDIVTTRPRQAIIRWAYLHAGHDEEILGGDGCGDGSGDNRLEAMVEADMVEDPCDVPRPAVLVVCRWCASWYIAILAVCASMLIPTIWWPIASALALSSASTLLARWED